MSSINMAPDPKDVTDFSFLQMRPIQLPTTSQLEDQVLKKPTQLLTVGNKIGLIFAGFQNGLAILDINQVEFLDSSAESKEQKKVAAQIGRGELPGSFHIDLPSSPTHVALNNEELILSVAITLKGLPHIYLFDTRAFVAFKTDVAKIKPFLQIPPSTPPGTFVQDLQWNPVTANLLAVVYSNGSLALFGITEDGKPPECWTLPPAEGITCINWSPKGKQLVAGRVNGSLTQYKPDLKEAKTIPGPQGKNLSAISILWVSTYQFVVAYKDNLEQNSRPGLYVVLASKAGPTTFTHYDDVCFSTGEDRAANFVAIPIMEWGLICVASANSIEVGLLGAVDTEQSNWVQWIPPDSGRAEIPLSADQSERYPVGVGLAKSTARKLQFGENVLPFSMPILFLLAPDGMLSGFYAVNRAPNVIQVTQNPQPLTSAAGMRPGTIDLPKNAPSVPLQQPAAVAATTKPPPPFEQAAASKPGFGFGGQTPFAASTPAKPAFKPFQPPDVSTGFGSGSVTISKPTPIAPASVTTAAVSTAPLTIPKIEKVKDANNKSNAEATFGKAIFEEINLFNNELKKFREKSASLNVNIGSQVEKSELKLARESMERFSKDVIEITSSQAKEISGLQKTNLELFSWVEEAKTRDVRSKNPRYRQLLKNRSLDPANQKKMSNLDAKFKYLEQQLQQVNEKLDSEWAEHLNKNKNKGIGGNTPSKDMVYKAILSNRNIIESEKNALAKITKEIKALKLRGSTNSTSAMEKQLDSSINQMTKMTESFHEKAKISESSPRVQKNESSHQQQFASPSRPAETVMSPSSQRSPSINVFSPEKQTALRSFLIAKGTTRVRPVKPPSLNESQFLKMVSPSKPDPESKSKALIDQLSQKEETTSKAEKAASAFSTFAPSVSSSKSSSSGSLSSCGVGLSTSSAFGGSTDLGFATRTEGQTKGGGSAAPVELGSFHKSSSFGGGMPSIGGITPLSSATANPIIRTAFSQAAFGGSLPKPAFSFPDSPVVGSSLPTPLKPASNVATPTKELQKLVEVSKPAPTPTTIIENKSSKPEQVATTATKPTTSTPFGGASTIGGGGQPISKGSIFGTPSRESKTTPISSSIFGTSTTATGSIFGSGTKKEGSPLTALSSVGATSTPTTTVASSSVLGGLVNKPEQPSSAKSFFGSSASSAVPTTAVSVKVTTSSSIFGSTGTSSGGSIFGGATITPVTTAASVSSATTPSSSIFGAIIGGVAATSTTTATSSIFGGGSGTTTTTASGAMFGGSGAATTTSVFGGGATFSSPGKNQSIFGASAASPAASGSIFGGGSGTTTTTASGSMFGGSGAATTTSVFGGGATPTSSSIFGKPASGGSIFGSPAVAPSTTASSAFSSPAATPASTASSAFGTPTAATSTPLFGSIFATAAAACTTASSGSASSGDSIFGGSKPVFSQPSTGSSSIFSSSTNPTTTSSIFGGSSTGGAGGGFFSGLGSTPSSDNANKNPFGVSTFGQPASSATTSLFGGQQQSTGAFGAKSGSIFGGTSGSAGVGGIFSGGSGSVVSQGFGIGQTTPVKSGFGTPAAFGGTPAFGSPPAFGALAVPSSPVFGGAPALGAGAVPPAFGASAISAPTTVFGSSLASDVPTFGSMGGGGSTFGNLSQQGTGSTFGGNFSQAQQGSGFGSFGSSGTSSGTSSSFGGGSPAFSSWR